MPNELEHRLHVLITGILIGLFLGGGLALVWCSRESETTLQKVRASFERERADTEILTDEQCWMLRHDPPETIVTIGRP